VEYSEEEQQRVRDYYARWQKYGPVLERIKAEELRRLNTAIALRAFHGMLGPVIAAYPPKPYSGLVELARVLRILRNRG